MSEASYIQQKITNPKEDKLLYAVVYSILFLFAVHPLPYYFYYLCPFRMAQRCNWGGSPAR